MTCYSAQSIKVTKTQVRTMLVNAHHEIKFSGTLDELLHCLISPPVMAYPNYEDPFILHVDAPQKGLGTVLYQKQNGTIRVIGYGSRTLTPSEQNYHLHSRKLEFLGPKWAVTEHFRDYLYYSKHFTVFTDNNPLTYVLSTANYMPLGYTGLASYQSLILISSTDRER